MGSVEVTWRPGTTRKRRPRRPIVGGGVNAQQTAAASENRLKRTKRRALSDSGCHGEGKSAFESPVLLASVALAATSAIFAASPSSWLFICWTHSSRWVMAEAPLRLIGIGAAFEASCRDRRKCPFVAEHDGRFSPASLRLVETVGLPYGHPGRRPGIRRPNETI